MDTELDEFLRGCAREIQRRAGLADEFGDELRVGAEAFSDALDGASYQSCELTTVPATRHLAGIDSAAALSRVPWAASTRLDDNGSAVALGLVDQVCDLGAVSCGLMLLAPGVAYPEHHHSPAEIYLPINGDGTWRFGGHADYRTLAEDELVYNQPNDVHSAVAGAEPLVALYVLL